MLHFGFQRINHLLGIGWNVNDLSCSTNQVGLHPSRFAWSLEYPPGVQYILWRILAGSSVHAPRNANKAILSQREIYNSTLRKNVQVLVRTLWLKLKGTYATTLDTRVRIKSYLVRMKNALWRWNAWRLGIIYPRSVSTLWFLQVHEHWMWREEWYEIKHWWWSKLVILNSHP